MKIFLSFLQSGHDHPVPAYSFWEYYIKNGIEEAGFEWTECPGVDWALGLVPQSKKDYLRWKQDAWPKTVAWLKKNPADIFLSYLYPSQVDAPAIKEIKKMGIPCVNFFCDNVREFKKAPKEFKIFDLNWVPEYKAARWYKKAGYPAINLPMPMWVAPQYRVLKEETNQQVTFIGSKDIQRKLLFEKVVEKAPELPLAIYGKGWIEDDVTPVQSLPADYTFSNKLKFNLGIIKHFGIVPLARKLKQRHWDTSISDLLNAKIHPAPSFEQYNTLTTESMITLGVNRYPSFRYPVKKPDAYSRLRDIEAPMLGACYLTEWTEGIEELYNTENEIAVYKTPADLINQVKALESDPARRKKLRENGHKRALDNHSIPNSLNKIKSFLGL